MEGSGCLGGRAEYGHRMEGVNDHLTAEKLLDVLR